MLEKLDISLKNKGNGEFDGFLTNLTLSEPATRARAFLKLFSTVLSTDFVNSLKAAVPPVPLCRIRAPKFRPFERFGAEKSVMLQMIIANRLSDGLVVFLGPEERWDVSIAQGIVTENDADAARLLEVAKAQEAQCQVVDPQLIEVEVADGKPRPTAIREAIRAFGPTVRTDLTEV